MSKVLCENGFLNQIGGLSSIVELATKAAIASFEWCGKGNSDAADLAAVESIREQLGLMPISGTIVIGEGERDEAPMLYIGEKVGRGSSGDIEVDIALDPLEGTTLVSWNMQGSMCVIAFAEKGSLLAAPDVYMEKLAVGPEIPKGAVSLNNSVAENIRAVAKAKKTDVENIRVCVLERPRHQKLIEEIYQTGARVQRILDGDVSASIQAALSSDTSIDMYIGTGGAPEGVLAAAALRCIGGQFQGRLILDTDEKRARAEQMFSARNEIKNNNSKNLQADSIMELEDLVSSDVVIALSGVTDGPLVNGVNKDAKNCTVNTLVYDSQNSTQYNLNVTSSI